MKRVHLILAAALIIWGGHCQARAQATNALPRPGLLQLLDGSTLHGGLQSISAEDGLVWKHPAARGPLQLLLTNLGTVRFDKASPPAHSLQPSCRFTFKNGDQVVGNIRSLKGKEFQLESWFGENLKTDVSALEGITFAARGYKLLYEGPNGTEGWKLGRNPRSWEYRDGAFIANGADLLGRDFGIKESSTLEFDLEWNGSFSLSITLYAQVIDRFDYSTSAYLIYLGTGAVSVQRVQAGSGAIMLGQTQLPDMLRRNRMHFEIRCNKNDATISLLTDGKFIARWKDNSQGGFVAKGGGIVFFSQVEPRALKISNIRVAEWDGNYEPEMLTNAPADMDVVYLANQDKVLGKILALDENSATVETRQTKLDIPLTRVTQMRFARPAVERELAPNEVRASFPGGESISFELERWNGRQVAGISPFFGPVTFDTKDIRQMQFNLKRSMPEEKNPSSLETSFPEFE